MGMRTPWGTAQHQEQITRGMIKVDTAGHGGIHLSPTLNAKVHPAWRDPGGWYEEDCQWAIVALTYPDLFAKPMPADGRHAGKTVAEYADHVARTWFPDEYEKVYQVTLTGADSYGRAEQEIAAAIVDQLRSVGAWGNGNDVAGRTRVPPGWVGVTAHVGGRYKAGSSKQEWYLVPEHEYDTRDHRAGVLIDPQRHPRWPLLPVEDFAHPVTVTIGARSRPRAASEPGERDTFTLFGAAQPNLHAEVGDLWRYPPSGDRPEQWRVNRRRGTVHTVTYDTFDTQEQALTAAGFRLAPYADVPAPVDVDAVFADLLTTTAGD